MAIDFPNSPATNNTHTVGDKTWIYADGKWSTSTGVSTTNASLLTSGTLNNARLPASATTITTVGTLSSLAVTNGVTAATFTGSLTGNATTVTTNAALTGDVTTTGLTNITTLTNAPVIAKVLTGYVSSAGTVAATDSILQAIQKLNGNNALKADLTGASFSGAITATQITTSSPTTKDQMRLEPSNTGTGGSLVTLRPTTLSSSRAVTFPDKSGTVAMTTDVDAVHERFSSGQATITPVANAATVGAVSWGRTLSSQPRVTTSANSAASTVTNTSFTDVTTTGCNVYILRTNTTATTVHAIAVVG